MNALDGSKVARLGWQPSTDFESGLPDTVRWYADNEEWHDYYERRYGWRLAETAPA